MADTIHVGDYGTTIEVQVMYKNAVGDLKILDISAATSMFIKLQKPGDGTTVTKTAVLVGDGTDGKMKYVVESGVIDTVGTWLVQGQVLFAASGWHTSKFEMRVVPPLGS